MTLLITSIEKEIMQGCTNDCNIHLKIIFKNTSPRLATKPLYTCDDPHNNFNINHVDLDVIYSGKTPNPDHLSCEPFSNLRILVNIENGKKFAKLKATDKIIGVASCIDFLTGRSGVNSFTNVLNLQTPLYLHHDTDDLVRPNTNNTKHLIEVSIKYLAHL